ncbi:MAG: hypothetical protein IPM32_14240 [Ignavibacteriae bacterium]|nr:hypothetical protein [Ignavibacteriota bacterium]
MDALIIADRILQISDSFNKIRIEVETILKESAEPVILNASERIRNIASEEVKNNYNNLENLKKKGVL